MTYAEASLEVGFCDHCGLPLGAQPCSLGGRRFCCYGCYLVYRIIGAQGERGVAAGVLARLGVGAFLAMNVMMISLLLYSDTLEGIGQQAREVFRWVLLGLSTPAVVILGLPFAAGAGTEVRSRTVSTDTLITLGVIAAYGVSVAHVLVGGHIYFDTATMLLVVLTLGRLLEATAKGRTSRVVRGLLELAAPTARLTTPEGEREVRPEEIIAGQRVRVKPGERVPVDGRVVSGVTTVEEALFTGESLPRVCRAGDRVFGSSVSADGEIVVEAEGVGEGALLAQMVRFVQQAQERRAPVERLAGRLSRVFIPLVLLAASGAWAYWHFARSQPERGAMAALAVLVVACPCALGLATPLVTALGLGRAARAGVLIRSGEALERLCHVSRLFLDKTGTLTRGTLALSDIACIGSGCPSAQEALAWLAALETASEHAVARAIVSAVPSDAPRGTVREFCAFPGEGATGTVCLDGAERQVAAGTRPFLERLGHRLPDAAPEAQPGATLVYIGWDGEVQAIASLSDRLRPEAKAAVAGLSALGLSVGVLSGDRTTVVRQLSGELGLGDVRGECTPDVKIAAIREARQAGAVVGMVGDGLNDAPALAEADVGIAMSGGTQLAQEASEVTLVGDDLLRLPWLFDLSRLAYRLIRQNLLWAFGYNAVTIAVAFCGWLHPLVAAVLMLGSSFFVLGNSLKLSRYPDPS